MDEEKLKIVREVVITVPIGYQITEDKYLKSYVSKKLKETDTIKDILGITAVRRNFLKTAIIN